MHVAKDASRAVGTGKPARGAMRSCRYSDPRPTPTQCVPQVPKVLVYYNSECGKREEVHMVAGRDEFWQDTVPHQSPQVRMADE